MFSWGSLSKPAKHACSSLQQPAYSGSKSVNLMNHAEESKLPNDTKYFDLLHHKVRKTSLDFKIDLRILGYVGIRNKLTIGTFLLTSVKFHSKLPFSRKKNENSFKAPFLA